MATAQNPAAIGLYTILVGAEAAVVRAAPMGALALLPVTALLLASSSAADSNPPEWLQAWDPQLMLLSVGSGDRRARPALEVLQGVEGYTRLRTNQNGWMHLSTDGEQMWVEVKKY